MRFHSFLLNHGIHSLSIKVLIAMVTISENLVQSWENRSQQKGTFFFHSFPMVFFELSFDNLPQKNQIILIDPG